METGHLRQTGNRNQFPIPITRPGFPVTLNPNTSFTSENHHHLTNPYNPNFHDEFLLDHTNASLLRSSALSSSRPKRKNVRISKDPQSVAARHRRERISERFRILRRMLPGGRTNMDTGSMLDEAIRYMKFLKRQVKCLEMVRPVQHGYGGGLGLGFSGPAEAEEVWGYNDYMASCMEMSDVLCQQGQSSIG